MQSHQQKISELEEQIAEQTLLLQQKHSDQERLQADRLSQCNRELDLLTRKFADLNCAVPAAGRSGQTTLQGQSEPTLRMTGLADHENETEEELLFTVQTILNKLPRSIQAEAARRQGRYGNKACAVIITFASVQDRLDTLRAKAALNRDESTKGYSIHEILSPEEQAQKNAMWQTFLQARRERRRASFRGCNLYIDGQLVPGPLQTDPAWDLQQMSMPGFVSNQALAPMPAASPSVFTNPLAQHHTSRFGPASHNLQHHDAMQMQSAWMPHPQQSQHAIQPMNGSALRTPMATRPMRSQ